MARSNGVKLSILSTYDSKGTDQGEKALQKFAKQFGEVDKATKQVKLDPVAEQLARQSIQADQAAAKLQAYSTKMTSVGKKLSLSVTAPIAAAGAAAFKLSTDFENAMNKVSTIADTSDVPLDTLRKSILQLSDDTGIAASDIADNVYNAISAGQKTGDAVAFVGNAAKLAKAGFTDSASALDVLTTTLNAYKLEADQASHVSDVLLQTQNKGKTTVGELSSSIGKAIPTAAAFNVNLENLAAAYATTTANGVATAESTTYIKSMLKELGDTGSLVGSIIYSVTGKSFSDLMVEGKNLGDVLNIVSKEGSAMGLTMYDVFGSAEAASAAAILASDNSSKFAENLTAMGDAAGLTDDSFNKMASTTGSMNKAFNRIKNSTLEFGDAIVADAQPILDGFTGTVKSVTEGFGSLDKEQRQTIVGVAAFAASLGPVTIAGGKVVGVASKMAKGYATLKAAQAAVIAGEMANGDALTRKTKILGTAGNALQKYATKANLAKAGAAGLAVVIAGVAIKALVDYKEHQDKVTKATDGLRNAQSRAKESARDAVSALQNAGNSAQDAATKASIFSRSWRDVASSVDSVIDSQAQLTDSIQQTFEQAYTTTGQLDSYMATIDELANKSNLTEGEQSRLTNAVKDLNDACGTGYEVTDALNGKIKDQEGNVLKTTDAIHKLVEAKKLEIQVDAVSAAAKEAYEQREQAARAVADAEQLLNEKIAARDALQTGDAQAWQAAQAEVDLAQQKLNEAKGAYDAAAESCASFDDQLNLLTTAQRNGTDTTQAWLAEHSDVVAVFANSGKSAVQFADKLSALGWKKDDMNRLSDALADTGLSMTDLAGLSDEALAQLVNDFDGSFDSILTSCQKEGTKIPKEFANKINQNSQKVKDASSRMSREASNAATQNANGAPAGNKLSNTAASGISALASKPLGAASSMIGNAVNAVFNGADGTSAGSRLSSTTAGGINTKGANANAATLAKNACNSAASKMNGNPIGANFSKGLANGIAAEAWRAGQAAVGVAAQVVNAVMHRWDQHSPSKVAQAIGQNWTKGLAIGEEDEGSIAVSNAVRVADDVISATAAKLDAYRPTVSVATTAATYDAKSIQGARVSELRIRVDRIDESLKDILAELKQLRASIPRAIRDNAPVVTMTEQQAARRVQKLVTMNV